MKLLSHFKPIELADQKVFNQAFARRRVAHNEYNFSTLFTWQVVNDYLWASYGDLLIVYVSKLGTLLMPIGGEFTLLDLHGISEEVKALGMQGEFSLFLREEIARLPELPSRFQIEEDRDNYDYVYSTEFLSHLPGTAVQRKRNLISQFHRTHPDYQVKEMSIEDFDKAYELSAKWCNLKNQDRLHHDSHEQYALEQTARYFRELNQSGLCVYVGSRLVAFSIFERQTEQMYSCHYEKFDPEVKGSGQIINQETAQYLLNKGVPWINREQDLGLEGLRAAKLSYKPEKFIEVCSLKPL